MVDKLEKIRTIVKQELSCSAHDMDHVNRVYRTCLYLAEGEDYVDLEVLKTAALLHDVARVREDEDDTGSIDHALLGSEMAQRILRDLDYDEEIVEQVRHCILSHRFRGSIEPATTEAKILFDADKLDVLGAVGLARSFMIAGQWGERIYSDEPLEQYVKQNLVGGRPDGRIKDISKHAPNIEFETKFRYVLGRLYTEKARDVACERIEFMEQFFDALRKELNVI